MLKSTDVGPGSAQMLNEGSRQPEYQRERGGICGAVGEIPDRRATQHQQLGVADDHGIGRARTWLDEGGLTEIAAGANAA